MGRLNVLILSDGKPGHLNQSRGIAHFLDTASVREVTVNFASGRREVFTRLALKRLLNKPPVQILKETATEIGLTVFDIEGDTPPDLIISTGNTTAAVAALLKRGFSCKAVHIMRPSLVPLEMFDAVILHAHDVSRNRSLPMNVLTMNIAPTALTPATLDELRVRARGRLGEGRFITVIIGGNSRQRELTPDIAHRLIKSLYKRAHREEARLLITTSRRTPGQVDELFVNEMEGSPAVADLVIANRDRINPITEYLSLSVGCVMTEESVSMIGEVASTGFVPLAVALRPKGRRVTKLDRFLENAQRDGLIRRQVRRPLGEFVLYEPFLPQRRDIDSPTQRCARRLVEMLGLF
jgi:mitochondrial fission protein ELM1